MPSDSTESSGDDSSAPGLSRLDYDLVADVELSHQWFPLTQFMDAADVLVEMEYLWFDSDESHLFFSVVQGDPESYEPMLANDETVLETTHVYSSSDRELYWATLSPDSMRLLSPLLEIGAFVYRIRGSGGNWSVRMLLGGREMLASLTSYCRRNDVSMSVDRLVTAESADGGELPGLTPSQVEMLRLAYEEGYYDVPRRVSQHELAEQLGVSTSAISQQLRRATGALVSDTLFR